MVSNPVMTAHCPFCKQAISPELAQYGGNCPKCMLEIPGEEAPTDPGAHVRARQHAEQQVVQEKERKRRWVVWAIAAAGLLVVAGVAGWKLQQEQEAITYNLDDYYVMPIEDIVAANEPPVPAPLDAAVLGRPATPVSRPHSTPSPGAATLAVDTSVGTSLRAASGTGDALPPELAAAMSATGGSTGLSGGSISVTRPDTVLDDPAEIKAMIGRVLAGSRPQLNACYQQRLKQVADLSGTWDLQFTVSTAGSATNVDATGRERGDGELESCMERAVTGWRFSKVAKAVGPVQVPFQFSAG
jgi:hypothetical protein